MGPEAKLEKRLREAVVAAGGLTIKLVSTPGMPDRLVILPEHKAAVHPRYVFVEMKAEHGRLSEIQKQRIRQLEGLGCEVQVVRGAEETDRFIGEVRKECSK